MKAARTLHASLCCVALLTSVALNPAHAAVTVLPSTQAWGEGAPYAASTPDLHCAVSKTYHNGHSLSVFHGQDTSSLALHLPDAALEGMTPRKMSATNSHGQRTTLKNVSIEGQHVTADFKRHAHVSKTFSDAEYVEFKIGDIEYSFGFDPQNAESTQVLNACLTATPVTASSMTALSPNQPRRGQPTSLTRFFTRSSPPVIEQQAESASIPAGVSHIVTQTPHAQSGSVLNPLPNIAEDTASVADDLAAELQTISPAAGEPTTEAVSAIEDMAAPQASATAEEYAAYDAPIEENIKQSQTPAPTQNPAPALTPPPPAISAALPPSDAALLESMKRKIFLLEREKAASRNKLVTIQQQEIQTMKSDLSSLQKIEEQAARITILEQKLESLLRQNINNNTTPTSPAPQE